MACHRALAAPRWAPVTVGTLRQGPRVAPQSVGRPHSGWM